MPGIFEKNKKNKTPLQLFSPFACLFIFIFLLVPLENIYAAACGFYAYNDEGVPTNIECYEAFPDGTQETQNNTPFNQTNCLNFLERHIQSYNQLSDFRGDDSHAANPFFVKDNSCNEFSVDKRPSESGKTGCFCTQKTNENASPQTDVRHAEFTTQAGCAGGTNLPDGTVLLHCTWFAPAAPVVGQRGITSLDLPINIESLNQFPGQTISSVMGKVIKTAMGIIGTIALVIVVGAGLMWMTAAGNTEREKKSKDMLFWGALGVLIMFSSYAFLQFILDAFK